MVTSNNIKKTEKWLIFLSSGKERSHLDNYFPRYMDQGVEKIEVSFLDGHQTKLVQYLSDTSNGLPPPCYIQMESKRPTIDVPSCNIPIVDLSLQHQPTEDEELRSALHSSGLFQAVGHGIPSSFLNNVRTLCKLFFHQPMQEKQKYISSGVEGYGNDEVHSEDEILDWSDRLYLQVHPKRERKMELWPETPVSFREMLLEYSEMTRVVMEMILKVMAKLLGLKADSFTSQVGEAIAVARFNYYPRCSRPDLVLGMKPHTDASVVTIILQDPDIDGLQVLDDQLGWVNVSIIPDALLVFLGDQIEIMSNGGYKSPMHKVVTNSSRERISVATFYGTCLEKEIAPASGLVGEGKPRLYKKVKVKEYMQLHLQERAQGKRTIDRAKV